MPSLRCAHAWRHRAIAFILLATSVGASGCYTRVIRVPGVVDLRSDGSGLEDAPATDVDSREGIEALISGKGPARQPDGRLVIEERTAWALGFFPVWNASADAELNDAMSDGGILTDVVVEERVTWTDVSLYATKLIPVVNLVGLWATPTITAYLSARQAMAPQQTSELPEAPPDFAIESAVGDGR